jgi:hypothetical protein
MLKNKQTDLATIPPELIQRSGKPVKQTKDNELSGSIQKDEKNKVSAILKSIWTGLAGGRLG